MSILSIIAFAFFLLAVIGLRWVRWQFLLRRWDVRVKTRESFLLFAGTLLFNFTPFGFAEVLRNLILVRKKIATAKRALALWVLDRGTDILAVVVVVAINLEASLSLVSALVVGLLIFYAGSLVSIRKNITVFDHFLSLIIVFLSSFVSWQAVAFASSVFLGISLADLLAPAYHALGLMHIVPAAVTLGFSFIVGIAFFNKTKTALFSKQHGTQDHFDDLSSQYNDLIPEHVQKLLLDKKINSTLKLFKNNGSSADKSLRVLDFGCGHGQYAIRFATLGHQVSACDRSSGQVAMAGKKAKEAGVKIDFHALESSALPFASNEFDLIYAINVFHHITDPKVVLHIVSEMQRVLKPGGMFILHDVNVRNPLFRFYMTYVFPLLKSIDDGTEVWLSPRQLKTELGGNWVPETEYFTFFPDFIPSGLMNLLRPIETRMENSFLKTWSAHFCSGMRKD